MSVTPETQCVAFAGHSLVASGPLADVALKVKSFIDDGHSAMVLIFDAETSAPIDVDFRGTADDVATRLANMGKTSAPATSSQIGRPKLGVVGREVTLLPRQWDWLSSQPGGASVTLRKLVDQARRSQVGKDQVRKAREQLYRFMVSLAGDLAGFEEATRAMFANDRKKFDKQIKAWPADIRAHIKRISSNAFLASDEDE